LSDGFLSSDLTRISGRNELINDTFGAAFSMLIGQHNCVRILFRDGSCWYDIVGDKVKHSFSSERICLLASESGSQAPTTNECNRNGRPNSGNSRLPCNPNKVHFSSLSAQGAFVLCSPRPGLRLIRSVDQGQEKGVQPLINVAARCKSGVVPSP
jgi:hypothetical protein